MSVCAECKRPTTCWCGLCHYCTDVMERENQEDE